MLCVFCNDTINYASSGKKVLHSHVRLTKHVAAYKLQSQNLKLVIPQSSSTVTITSDSTNQFVPMCDRIANNQAMVLAVMAENSLPMTMAPVLIDLAKQLARDPKALGSLSMDRTSASYKMTHGVHKTMQDRTVQAMRNVPFCLNKRVLGVLVSYFSESEGRVVVEHLTALELVTVNTQSVMKCLCDLFTKHAIPWTGLLAILMDSCAVMRGSENGLEVRIRREHTPLLLDTDGDICHHIHNASKRFCKPFDGVVEGLFNDIYNDHKWSVDLRELLAEVCSLIGVKFTVPERFINHRWLSAYDTAVSTCRLWDAHQVFYYGFLRRHDDQRTYYDIVLAILRKHNVNENGRTRIKEIWTFLRANNLTDDGRNRKKRIVEKVLYKDMQTMLIMLFYQAVLPLLKNYVVLFQNNAPLVHKLHDRQEQLFRDFLSCFIRQEELVDKSAQQLKNLGLTDDLALKKKDIFIGGKASDMIKGCRKDDSTVKGFRKQACEAYMQCATYLQVKLPLDNAFLRAASSIDPTAHGHHLCTRMLKRLKDLVPCNLSDDERQGFDLEVHQLMVDQNLPAFSEPEGDRVDEWWAKVHATQRYKAVSKVALAVCCVFHGPRIESSFNTMGDIIHSKSANTQVETYAAVQGIKYNLKARNATAIKLFGKSCPAKDPVDRQMCVNIRQSSGVYRRIVGERRVEQQRKQKLMGLKKNLQSKKAAKMAMGKKAQEERLRHIRKQQRKSRLRALQELAKKVKKKKERRTKDAPKRK